MLVLSRSVGETIRIGPDVYVTIVKITPHSIRLGIEAPQQASIVRGELLGEGRSFDHLIDVVIPRDVADASEA